MSRSPWLAPDACFLPGPAESGTKGGGCVNNAANVINIEQARNELSDDTAFLFPYTCTYAVISKKKCGILVDSTKFFVSPHWNQITEHILLDLPACSIPVSILKTIYICSVVLKIHNFRLIILLIWYIKIS